MFYFLKHLSDTLLTTKKYLADIALYGHVKCLWTDNGTEFTSEPLQQLLVLNRIKHERSAPYSPHGHDELYFLLQGVSLLSQNCLKTCSFMH